MSISDDELQKLIDKAMQYAESDRQELDKFIANLIQESQNRNNTIKNEFGQQVEVLKNHDLSPLIVKLYETKLKTTDQLIKLATVKQKDRSAIMKTDDDGFGINEEKLYESVEEEDEFVFEIKDEE